MIGVAEVFRSIQGEGAMAGVPMWFVRLAGCAVACPIRAVCDTDFSLRSTLGPTEIAREAARWGVQWACVTGGEPAEQRGLADLVWSLRDEGLRVMLQTSGAHEVPDVDYLVVSPKSAPLRVTVADELKVVWTDQGVGRVLELGEQVVATRRYLQPLWTDEGPNTEATLAALAAMPGWRLSVQTHKYIGLP